MAPLVSPFCSPLSSTSLERAGVPAGKQSRPIAARPYPGWTNRRRARRAKMNGSLSIESLLTLIFASDYTSNSLSSLRLQAALACSLAYTRRALSVRRSVRSPFASAAVLATLPYTLQRSNASYGILCPPLSYSFLSFLFSLSFSFSLSLFLSLAISLSRYLFFSRSLFFFLISLTFLYHYTNFYTSELSFLPFNSDQNSAF